ncbi:MAG: Uncharacterized protein AWU57_982 [Marinobacter sp. T13-3]|jgi:hypothetical protein|nr:MAG: Uncharacterized protein AWU57_982 [Marinobacter sp. T13-3]
MNLRPIIKKIKADETPEAQRAWRRHIARIEKMTAAIEERFPDVKQLNQIQLKHCEWLVKNWLSPTTARDYRSSLKLLIMAQRKDCNWFKRLGIATPSTGGRRSLVNVVRSRSPKFD